MGLESGQDKKKQLSRRRFLRMSVAAGALGAVGMLARHANRNQRWIENDRAEAMKPKELTFLNATRKPMGYEMGKLEGVRINKQFMRYFKPEQEGEPLLDVEFLAVENNQTVSEHVPLPRPRPPEKLSNQLHQVEQLDFTYQLSYLWREKLEKMRGDEPIEEFDIHHDGVLTSIEDIYKSYEPPRPGEGETLHDYQKNILDSMKQVDKEFDWGTFSKHMHVKGDQLQVVYEAMKRIDAKLLLSYALTELMPSGNGRINVEAFEFLLKNGGRGFVERIPALGDTLISFGPYQFTEYALKNFLNKKNKTELNGASRIDATLKHSMIPQNVFSLRGNDHHKAAYLFSIYNMSILAKNIGEHGCQKLLQNLIGFDTTVRDYVIAAHHRPSAALKAFKKFEEYKRYPYVSGRRKTLAEFCPEDVGTYVKKARANGDAIAAFYKGEART